MNLRRGDELASGISKVSTRKNNSAKQNENNKRKATCPYKCIFICIILGILVITMALLATLVLNLSLYSKVTAIDDADDPTFSPQSDIPADPTSIPTAITISPVVAPISDSTDFGTEEPIYRPVTILPTFSPTIQPTDSPTKLPTQKPTFSPTKQPTHSPTKLPKQNPTISPTKQPTNSPTGAPTATPTISPTMQPTDSPTKLPTQNPTFSPRIQPTDSPTEAPTQKPTFSPTMQPTDSPTKLPTQNPTVSPTKQPTNSPTGAPTLNPTISPTTQPTDSPTRLPTQNPIMSPTEQTAEPDFCNQVGEEDENIRNTLFQSHELVTVGTFVFIRIIGNDLAIKCLPENCLSYFDSSTYSTTQQLKIDSNIQVIHPNAFSSEISFIKNIRYMDLGGNALTSLPDGVFSGFEKMQTLMLTSNNFVTLNNNILGSNSQLKNAQLNSQDYLREFPEFIKYAPSLQVLYLTNAKSLSIANSEAFEGVDNLAYLILTAPVTPVYLELGKQGLAQALNINPSVFYLLN